MNASKPTYLPWLALLTSLIFFVFLRVYQIDSSLLFFGDMGRDFLEFHEWQTTGIPPLLGPQTSALPFNQSAVYFYVLYPFYQLFSHSLLSTVYATLLIHLVAFGVVAWLMRKHPTRIFQLSFLIFLFGIHPQSVIQHRLVWNPSFVSLFIILAYISQAWLVKSRKQSWLVAVFLALAVSFSYSALPIVIAWILVYQRSAIVHFSLQLASSLVLVNLPTLVFELRHGWLLTNMMLFGDKLSQAGSSLAQKSYNILFLSLGDPSEPLVLLMGGLLFCLVLHHIFLPDTASKQTLALTLLTFLLTLIAPFPMHSHYIFPILTAGLLAFLYAPGRLQLALFITAAGLWLNPNQMLDYFKPAIRSGVETRTCATQVCQQLASTPAYVSVQAGFHNYHDAKDWRYLLSHAGCQVSDMTIPQFDANHMFVVADQGIYTHGATAYHELTLFGPSQLVNQISCQSAGVTVYVLER